MTLDRLVSPEMVDVWRLLGALLGTLVLVAATLWVGRQAAGQVRGVWRAVRGYEGTALRAVDQPTDPVIVQLARLSGVPAGVWAAFLPVLLSALAAGLDHALAEEAPGE